MTSKNNRGLLRPCCFISCFFSVLVLEWQHECLSHPALQQNSNLIYSLPTSGGKTLVAEILILREILCKKRDAILVLPYVAIVQEKVRLVMYGCCACSNYVYIFLQVRGLAQFAVELDFLVEEYAGAKGTFPPKVRRKRNTLFVCTIEKAHSLLNSLIENDRQQQVGLVVVDEVIASVAFLSLN